MTYTYLTCIEVIVTCTNCVKCIININNLYLIVAYVAGSPCVDPNSKAAFVFQPIKPGDYLAQVEPTVLPPASTPIPPLRVTDVVDPPLPPVNAAARKEADSDKSGGGSESGQRRMAVDVVATMLLLIVVFFLMGC